MKFTITKRQEKILNGVVREYINSAEPVSSQFLDEKYNFDVSPATLRNEMQTLCDLDFLFQPHTSAGRIPTDKGYRFFVNEIFERGFSDFDNQKKLDIKKECKKKIDNSFRLTQEVTKILASNSSNLALGHLLDEDFFWKDGWDDLFEEPEFKEADFISRFAKLINSFEKNIEEINSSFSNDIQVFIGKETPFFRNEDFSIVVSRFNYPNLKNKKGMFAIVGPKRMNYNKNISIINMLDQIFKEF